MASDSASTASDRTVMTPMDLITFTKKELDTETERQAKVTADSNGEVPRESQTGVTLDLSGRNIRELPSELIDLIKDKVERLALSRNPQVIVPSEIILCSRLRYLNIKWSGLKQFPEAVLQLSKLEILDLSKNHLTTIPEDIKRMTSLKFLAVTRNDIKRLPLALGEMTSLHKLKFDENPIEFPTLDELKLPEDRAANPTLDAEKERAICQQVKRVLKNKALRQRLLKPKTEDEVSETNVETPRPPKRGISGRFPVRPSVSGIENVGDLTPTASTSPSAGAPPIPQRSHARNPSKTYANDDKRPTVAPLYNGSGIANRSRSDTVSTAASLRTRRQGFLPAKGNDDLESVTELTAEETSRASTASTSTIKASHSHNASTSSTLNGFPNSSSGAESSSSATRPTIGQERRHAQPRRQIQHPEHPSRVQRSPAMHAARRLQFSLYQLHRPIHQTAIGLVEGTPKRSMLERQLFSASAHVEELDRLLARLDGRLEEGPKREEACAQHIIVVALAGIKAYASVMSQMKHYMKKIGYVLNPQHTRCLMIQLYAAMVEARNVIQLLGIPMRLVAPRDTPRASRVSHAWSSRTVTPTQSRPTITSKRLRGATILRNQTSSSTLRVVPPTRPSNDAFSRSNTLTFLSAATPRSGESFGTVQSAILPSRSNTLRSLNIHSSDEADDNNEQFERIFLKLRAACDVAGKVLPECHAEITVNMDKAVREGQAKIVRPWSMALKSCNKIVSANHSLSGRLKSVKLNDPGMRSQKDFWQLCDTFVQTWTEFATDIKDIGSMRIDIAAIRDLMKAMQRAVKDVSKTISESPLYHQALRNPAVAGHASQGLAPPFPTGLNTALAQAVASAQHHGLSNPSSANPTSAHSATTISVPATPLAAALGPAAQATVAGTSSTSQSSMADYFHAAGPGAPLGARTMHERVDTVMAPAGASAGQVSAVPQVQGAAYGHGHSAAYPRRG